MPSTVLVSTDAAGSPAAAASFMHSASLKTTPSKAIDRGFQDVRARRAAQGKADVAAFDTHGEFILRAGKREAYSFLARQKRTFRQFLQHCGEFLVRKACGSRSCARAELRRSE